MKSLVVLLALATGCSWSLHRMQEQPGFRVARSTDLLPSGSCNLQPPDGTVPAGAPPTPPALTRDLVERGRNRFDIFCAPCHGIAGDGDSQISRIMTLRRPPSLVGAPAASLPDDRYLFVMEHGYGVMPSYASAVMYRDRYAILYYVRALQHRRVELATLPPQLQQEAMKWLR